MTIPKFKSLLEQIVEQELNEMPIANYKTIGDFSKGSSFRHKTDRTLLTHPKAIEKIHRQWEKTPYDFDLYIVNDKRVNKEQFREVGKVNIDFVRNQMKITPEEIPDPASNHITIIFTNNNGDERYMASGWILAHRVGHALARGNRGAWEYFTRELREIFANILDQVYNIKLKSSRGSSVESDKILKLAAQQMGTMKAARDNNLRNWYEFSYELLAQYMITGKIKLNPLPDKLLSAIEAFGRKRYSTAHTETQRLYNEDLDMYEETIEHYIENALSEAVGNIYVM